MNCDETGVETAHLAIGRMPRECITRTMLDETSRARIERLKGSPADCLGALIAESEQYGLRFVRRLADEWSSGANRFDRPGEVLLVARIAGHIVGVCGLNVGPYAAVPSIGRVRHLYVLTAHRRIGVGRQLVSEIIHSARGQFDSLHLRTQSVVAAQLYERLGFRRCVGVPDRTHVMDLPLSADPASG